MLFIGCNKESKHSGMIGIYSGVFTYSSSLEKYTPIVITEATNNYLVINEGVIYLDGKKIDGKIKDLYFAPDKITIIGEWKRKGKKYSFSGTFSEITYYLGIPQTSHGTFEIVPK